MAKHAFLILAHDQPRRLKRLIEALRHDNFDIYVHIDGKAPISHFLTEGAVYTKDRARCYWGDYSIVKATLNLINEALSSGEKYGYLTLLSGADYPCASSNRMFDFFSNADREFIDCFQTTEEKWHDRYRLHHYRNPGLGRRFMKRFMKAGLRKTPSRRTMPYNLEPYWGSQWWSLTADAAGHVFNTLLNRPELVRFFKYVDCPDEMLFQTILGNSPYKEKFGENRRYVDWRDSVSSPRVLSTPDDFGKIRNSNCLFARKFDEDNPILDWIDRELRL
jgi:hypothetical protein